MCIFLLNDLIAQLQGLLDSEKYKHVISMLEMIRAQMSLMECFVEDLLSYNMI